MPDEKRQRLDQAKSERALGIRRANSNLDLMRCQSPTYQTSPPPNHHPATNHQPPTNNKRPTPRLTHHHHPDILLTTQPTLHPTSPHTHPTPFPSPMPPPPPPPPPHFPTNLCSPLLFLLNPVKIPHCHLSIIQPLIPKRRGVIFR